MLFFNRTSKIEKLQGQTAKVELAMAKEKLRQQRRNRRQVQLPTPETRQDHTRESVEDYQDRLRHIHSGKR